MRAGPHHARHLTNVIINLVNQHVGEQRRRPDEVNTLIFDKKDILIRLIRSCAVVGRVEDVATLAWSIRT